ncbi:hypothetical protein EOD39_7295 [Acipenser ruthenus]|uniref:Anaphase-promoting complex subunit 10 n=1 Tax=Acipenser ruthenus TaxID=7906 RepID=A0A444U7E0_ACIRT|nr:hypothetical protein EOD39_7295 [Acipenser ruthenus]
MAAAFQWYDNLRGWLIGVNGYPLKQWLLRLLLNPTTPAEGIIVPFKCARTVIERTFGILKMLFRCLDVCGGTLQYTPQKKLELVEPSGWIHIPLLDIVNNPIQTFMIQIALLSNHQNGKDTHMRQIKVYTPVEESSIGKFRRCTTLDFMMYRTIR